MPIGWNTLSRRGMLGGALAVVAIAAVGALARRALASDHQDSPEVELNPAQDMTDFYAFPSATTGNIVLVLNSWAFLTPAATPSTQDVSRL